MHDIWAIVAKWDPLMQFLFFAGVISIIAGGVVSVAKYVVTLFRGWPPSPDHHNNSGDCKKSEEISDDADG
jgi:hypothetical protein